jgi:hypothetical protein
VWHVNKNVQTEASRLWRVNNVSEEENKANKEKRKEFMAKWEEASCTTLTCTSFHMAPPLIMYIGCSG